MLSGIQTASPPFRVKQLTAAEKLKKKMTGRPALSRLIDSAAQHSGIDSRYVVIPDGYDDAENHFYNGGVPDTETRMLEYKKWAPALSINAVEKLFTDLNADPTTVDKLITISCTGFYAPGLDYDIINHFGLRKNIKRTNIGFMGCAASLVGFNNIFDMPAGENSHTLIVSVELCSLHLQVEPTRDNILANMIFADGAAAALFTPDKLNRTGFEIIKTHSVLFDNSAAVMGWEIGNTGFIMNLSPELPDLILKYAVPDLIAFFEDQKISIDEIQHWALHPGGRAILDALQKGLCLSDNKMRHSRNVLWEYGNLSSASILFVMKDLMDKAEIRKNQLCCAVAFGPGLTMEVALLKSV